MALMKCPECGKDISDKADSCPHCGYPLKNTINSNTESYVKQEIDTNSNNKKTKKEKKEHKQINNMPKKSKNIIIAAIVVGIIGIGITFYCTADLRHYSSATDLYEEGSYKEALEIFNSLDGYKDSNKMAKKCKFELSVDGRFINSLEKGLNARWDKGDELIQSGQVNGQNSKIYVQSSEVELKYLDKFDKEKFKDKELEELAKNYIQSLHDGKEAAKYFSTDYNTFMQKWQQAAAQRLTTLKKIDEKYKLELGSKHQDKIDQMFTDADAYEEQQNFDAEIEKMMKGFKLTTTEDEWGLQKNILSMKNTTDLTFDYFSVTLSVVDSNGKIIASGNSSQVTAWAPNQEAETEVFFSTKLPAEGSYTLKYIPHYQSGTMFK